MGLPSQLVGFNSTVWSLRVSKSLSVSAKVTTSEHLIAGFSKVED